MADRIAPAPSLSPTASPVSRYVAPVTQQPDEGGFMSGLADALSTLNPELQKYMVNQNAENAAAQEAEGAQAESGIDPRYQFEKGRQNWNKLISSERKRDKENGTANADRLAAASPHFRRGLMKSRLNRIGMGLNDFLMNQWRGNPMVQTPQGAMPIHEVDDPAALQAWVAEQTAGYTDRFGTANMDPLLVGETLLPRVTAAQDGFLSRHTEFRLQRWQQDYEQELSMNVGMVLAGGGTNASPVDDFIARLAGTESRGSGGYAADNKIGYVGLIQFGQARLTDYNRANGTNYTLEQFRTSPEVQRHANRWHINDLDNFIESQGYLVDTGYSLDGLRAVAHLGGKKGLRKFVESGGAHNPKDVNGTSLQKYYDIYSGPSSQLQQQLDTATTDGMDPQRANKTIVDSLILTAKQTKNPAVLAQLDTINTGSGTLGQIGWVKEARMQAEEQIEAALYTEQRREAAAATAEAKARSLAVQTDATRAIFEDPWSDVSGFVQQAIDGGDPALAKTINDLSEQLRDQDVEVRVDDNEVMAIRFGIATGALDQRGAMMAISEGIVSGKLDQSVGRQLLDDAQDVERFSDSLSDSRVQDTLNDFERIVAQNFQTPSQFNQPPIPGTAQGIEARQALEQRVIQFIAENKDASKTELRDYVQQEFDRQMKMPFWKPTQEMRDTGEVGDFGMRRESALTIAELQEFSHNGFAMPTLQELNTPERMERINQLATQAGMSTKDFLERYGIK